jgi:RNA polymerase sigma-70 factor (ECF subfamily)
MFLRAASLASAQQLDKPLAEEHRLIREAQQGQREAYAALAERYYDRLYRWLCHLTRDRHTAEDLVQETFLKAFTALDRFRTGSNFQAWIFRIAHNNWVNQRRSAARQREALPDNLPGPDDDPAVEAAQRETHARIGRAVQELPPEFRAALLLRAEENLSFRQIAEVLGLTEETARWRVFKARQKLLSALALEQETP